MTFVLAAQAATVPTTPAINLLSFNDTTATLGLVTPSTENVYGLLGYDIERSTDAGVTWSRIAIVVDMPYIVTLLTAGTNYRLRARGVSSNDAGYRSAASNVINMTTTGGGGPPPPTRRVFADWGVAISQPQSGTRPHDLPGGYIGVPNGGTVTGKYPTNVATGGVVSNNGPVCSGVNYITIRHNWRELDNGDGTFNYAHLDKEIAQARGLGVGIYWVIITRSFNGTGSDPVENPAPVDIASYAEPYTGSIQDGWQVWRWSPKVLQRFQQLCNAIGARYDLDPNFAGIGTQETATGGAAGGANGNYTVSLGALGNYVGSDSYDNGALAGSQGTNFTSALKMELKIIGAACPHARPLFYGNFLASTGNAEQSADMLAIAIVAQTVGAMWGFPDLVTDLEPGGVRNVVYPNVQKYHNGSNGIAHPGLTFGCIQPSEWTGTKGPAQNPPIAFPPGPLNPSMQDLYNWAKQSHTYPTSLATGARDHSPTAPTSQRSILNLCSILTDWHNSGNPNFKADIVPIIQAHPILQTVTPNP